MVGQVYGKRELVSSWIYSTFGEVLEDVDIMLQNVLALDVANPRMIPEIPSVEVALLSPLELDPYPVRVKDLSQFQDNHSVDAGT